MKDGLVDEPALLKLYMDLTGSSEMSARSVWVHVGSYAGATQKGESPGGVAAVNPHTAVVRTALLLCAFLTLPLSASAAGEDSDSEVRSLLSSPLSLADAINLGLHQSPGILRAQKAVEAQEGVAIQTRAIALPKVAISGNYTAVQPSAVDSPPVEFPGFVFGTDQSWASQIRLVQSLYEGGRIMSSLRSAKLLKERAGLEYQAAVADLVLDVQQSYFAVLLAEQQIAVQEASVQLLTSELADTTRRFDAGTVPRFNVLRAEVELANARPNLSRARNRLQISRSVLARVLAIGSPGAAVAEYPFVLSDKMEAGPWRIDVTRALGVALEQRKELAALRKTELLRKEDVISAKAGYKPALEAFAGYGAQSSMFSPDLTDESHGWRTGVQLRWDIFDGRLTAGRVKQARAQHDAARIELDDVSRRIELEVRTAYSTFREAGEVLESQEKVQAQAEEALRLARSRADAGTGTQLDVLSAQTALTEARSTQVQALHDYVIARARLEHAMGINVPVGSQP